MPCCFYLATAFTLFIGGGFLECIYHRIANETSSTFAMKLFRVYHRCYVLSPPSSHPVFGTSLFTANRAKICKVKCKSDLILNYAGYYVEAARSYILPSGCSELVRHSMPSRLPLSSLPHQHTCMRDCGQYARDWDWEWGSRALKHANSMLEIWYTCGLTHASNHGPFCWTG